MNNTTEERKQFAAIMLAVAEEFCGSISKLNMNIRFEALKEYTIEQIGSAATWLIKHREATFPPNPTVREFIDVMKRLNNPQLSTKSAAELQADEVMERVRCYAFDREERFDDLITQKLMTTRWPFKIFAKNLQEDEIKWWRREFFSAYEAYKESSDLNQLVLENNQIADNVLAFIAQ